MLDYHCAKFSQIQIETVQMMLLSMVNLPNLLCTYKAWPKQGDRKYIFLRNFFYFGIHSKLVENFSPYLFQASVSFLQEPSENISGENITCDSLIFSDSIEMEYWLKMA